MTVRLVCSLDCCAAEYDRDAWHATKARYCSRECRRTASILSWAVSMQNATASHMSNTDMARMFGISISALGIRKRRLREYVKTYPLVAVMFTPSDAASGSSLLTT